jgi:hypothetical protein
MELKLPKQLLERWNKLSQGESSDNKITSLDWIEKINDRSKQVMDRNPNFFPDLMFILSGQQGDDNNSVDGVMADESKGRVKRKDKILKKFSAEEIKGLCKSRYSLMTLQDFLLILNRMNSASAGNLLKDK